MGASHAYVVGSRQARPASGRDTQVGSRSRDATASAGRGPVRRSRGAAAASHQLSWWDGRVTRVRRGVSTGSTSEWAGHTSRVTVSGRNRRRWSSVSRPGETISGCCGSFSSAFLVGWARHTRTSRGLDRLDQRVGATQKSGHGLGTQPPPLVELVEARRDDLGVLRQLLVSFPGGMPRDTRVRRGASTGSTSEWARHTSRVTVSGRNLRRWSSLSRLGETILGRGGSLSSAFLAGCPATHAYVAGSRQARPTTGRERQVGSRVSTDSNSKLDRRRGAKHRSGGRADGAGRDGRGGLTGAKWERRAGEGVHREGISGLTEGCQVGP